MANKSGNPNWKKGTPRPPNSGRKKGTPNKLTNDIKEMVVNALNDERVGGEEGFIKWIITSKRNKELFFSWCMKLLPSNVGVELSGGGGEPIKIEFVPVKKKEKK